MILGVVRRCKSAVEFGGIPVWRQCVEIGLLFVFKRIGPGYYFLGRFWRPEMRLRDKFGHFNESEYRRAINRLNGVLYQKISQHKVSEKALLALQGLPTPTFVGFYHPQRGSDHQGRLLRGDTNLQRLLAEHIGQRLCFKDVEGSGGSSFSALDVINQDGAIALRHPLTGRLFELEEWAERLDQARTGWIIEKFLPQHPKLAALNPDSVNTLRLIVLRTREGFKVRGAILRIGRTGSQVDNLTSGGLACKVDLESGRITEARDLSPMRKAHTLHPDSNAQIVGFVVPHWEACLDTASRALAAFPHMNFAGIDIAITEQGPTVIELNVNPSRRFAAILDLPHDRLFADVI